MDAMNTIDKRTSTRFFKNTEINHEVIKTIISAGLKAPSPKNRQPWHFIAITNKEEKKKLADAMENEINGLIIKKPQRQDIKASLDTIAIIRQAPVLVLVCYENNMVKIHDDGVNWNIAAKDIEAVDIQSIGAAVENMLLQAEALRIGSLWCADILYAYQSVASYSKYPVLSAVCFGYKNRVSKSPTRKSMEEKCVFI